MSMKAFVLGGVVACGLLVAGTQVSAHHSFAAEFDADKRIELTVDDPGAYTRPWSAASWTLRWVGGKEMSRHLCQENRS